MKLNIAVLPGDGIGPEIMPQAIKVLDAVAKKFNHEFAYHEAICGAHAIDEVGDPFPEATFKTCMEADAVLFAAVGDLRFDNDPTLKVRPETGLLAMRKHSDCLPCTPRGHLRLLAPQPPLKEESIKGADFVVIRELTGGMYFGEKYQDNDKAYDTDIYYRPEIERILKVGFEFAQKRNKHLTVVDKANVLASSRLWRQIGKEMEPQYPDVTVDYMFIDNCAMRVLTEPRFFDVQRDREHLRRHPHRRGPVPSRALWGLQPSASLGEHTPLFEPYTALGHRLPAKHCQFPAGADSSSAADVCSNTLPERGGALIRKACDASPGAECAYT
jgi:3-isopropylmalate dehydrogenase